MTGILKGSICFGYCVHYITAYPPFVHLCACRIRLHVNGLQCKASVSAATCGLFQMKKIKSIEWTK